MDKCPRCDDYDEVVEELKKEKDTRERGAKDELRKCEEKNKSRDKKIKGLEKKILAMTIAAVVGGTIVGKDVLDKITEYIQSFNSIKDAATKLTTSVDNDSNKEVVKNDDEQIEETEYVRTLTLAPRKIDTGEWPSLMSTSDIKAYQSRTKVDYGLPLSSFIDIPNIEMLSVTDIIIQDMIDKPIDFFETELVLIGDILPPIELTPMEFPSEPYTFFASSVPESSTLVVMAGFPVLFSRRRRD
jgi:hypothetical protein